MVRKQKVNKTKANAQIIVPTVSGGQDVRCLVPEINYGIRKTNCTIVPTVDETPPRPKPCHHLTVRSGGSTWSSRLSSGSHGSSGGVTRNENKKKMLFGTIFHPLIQRQADTVVLILTKWSK